MIPLAFRPLIAGLSAGTGLTVLWAAILGAMPDGAAPPSREPPPSVVDAGPAANPGGPHGGALFLDGRSRLAVPALARLPPASGLTIDFWVKPLDATKRQQLLRAEGADGWRLLWTDPLATPPETAPSLWLRIQPVTRGGDTTAELTSAETPLVGRWVHFALVVDASRARMLVNGEIVADTKLRGAPLIPSGNFVLGDEFIGLVDEFRIRRGVPTPDELRRLAEPVDDPRELVLHLEFDDAAAPWRDTSVAGWAVVPAGDPQVVSAR